MQCFFTVRCFCIFDLGFTFLASLLVRYQCIVVVILIVHYIATLCSSKYKQCVYYLILPALDTPTMLGDLSHISMNSEFVFVLAYYDFHTDALILSQTFPLFLLVSLLNTFIGNWLDYCLIDPYFRYTTL